MDSLQPNFSPTAPLPSWILTEKENSRIQHRRKILQERAERIHQPKATTIAVDVEALNRQSEDRKEAKLKEQEETKNYEEMAMKFDKLSVLHDIRLQKQKEAEIQALKSYWKHEQPLENRRERDLNCKAYTQDPGYYLAFIGEDEGKKHRELAQKKQMKEFLKTQMEREQHYKEAERMRRREENFAFCALSERAKRLAEVEELCKKAEELARFKRNQELSEEKERETTKKNQEERRAVEDHIRHNLNSTLLTEDERVARSALGPHRVLCDRWKGMSSKEKQNCHHQLMLQIQENKERRQKEEEIDKTFQNQAEISDQIASKVARKNDERRKDLVQDVERQNADLAEQQNRQQKIYNRIVGTNQMDDDFFGQFGIYPR